MKTKCSTCDGIFDPTSPDGARYFHRCPPLRRLRVREANGTYSTVAPGTEGARVVVGERFVDRPQLRDENVILDPQTGLGVPIATGTGTTQVNDNAIP